MFCDSAWRRISHYNTASVLATRLESLNQWASVPSREHTTQFPPPPPPPPTSLLPTTASQWTHQVEGVDEDSPRLVSKPGGRAQHESSNTQRTSGGRSGHVWLCMWWWMSLGDKWRCRGGQDLTNPLTVMHNTTVFFKQTQAELSPLPVFSSPVIRQTNFISQRLKPRV